MTNVLRIGGGGTGVLGYPNPLSGGTAQALNVEVYRALSAHLYINHSFMSWKRKTLKSAAKNVSREACPRTPYNAVHLYTAKI